MKKRDLERELKNLGWYLKKQGGNHEIWTNGRGDIQPVPRHNEIKEQLALAIIKAARLNPGK